MPITPRSARTGAKTCTPWVTVRRFSSMSLSQLLQTSQGGPSSTSMHWASLRTSASVVIGPAMHRTAESINAPLGSASLHSAGYRNRCACDSARGIGR